MASVIRRRIVNSTVWIGSGIVVLVRAPVIQGGFVLLWETVGGGMMIYGAARLVWALLKAPSTKRASI